MNDELDLNPEQMTFSVQHSSFSVPQNAVSTLHEGARG